MAEIEIWRGDIVLVDLSGALGGEKKNDASIGARPCVVVQNDGGNRASPLTIVAPLNDAKQYKGYPTQVQVTPQDGVQKDCIVDCGHLRNIDRDARIQKWLGRLSAAAMTRVNEALKASLGL
ncbi:type II toxin-antitoxin system PemK/MazF family toxin [Mitsuaria sp. 7]|uniref:type II toxin-antitoxin system PemK/MazF family toxin n=1 Tax=Mitsuaria sp. 7 TaxID=1658665 RepID=UPI0007DCC7CC|nr:type II toxin-antitoxin system PemK/MazF family toxin [Mitsuaria sp. 7]ANH66663.1 hypothetical protein ABE85_02145 [Mitsuaria sp. 7]